jgi:hypothetical protein
LFFFFLVLDPVPNLNGELVAVYLHAPRLGRGLAPKRFSPRKISMPSPVPLRR